MNKLALILLVIFLSPVSVFFKNDVGKEHIINVALCSLFFVPAVIHAFGLVTK